MYAFASKCIEKNKTVTLLLSTELEKVLQKCREQAGRGNADLIFFEVKLPLLEKKGRNMTILIIRALIT